MKTLSRYFIKSVLAALLMSSVQANEVEVTKVVAHQLNDKTWKFAVTLKHGDTGWDHYANEWQVIGPDNKILGTRTLYHPHVDEQPFTRSLSGIKIPENLDSVRVIAKDTVHGLSKKAMEVNLKTKENKAIELALKKAK